MRRLAALLLPAMMACPAGAATDFQLWTEAGVRVKLAKSWRLRFDQHVRFDEWYAQGELGSYSQHSIIPELAITYRALKFLRLEAGCRYTAELRESRESLHGEHWGRIFVGGQLRFRLKPVTFRYRLRYQEEFGEPMANDGEYLARHTFRNKIGIEWRAVQGFVPFVSGELFHRVADPDGTWHKWRVTAGLGYEIGDHTISLFYRFEDMLDEADKPDRHILGVAYHHGF